RTCQSQIPRGEVLVKLEPEESEWAESRRRFFLLNHKANLLGYTYATPGSTVRVPLVPEEKYVLREISTAAEWGKSTPIFVGNEGSEIISLSRRNTGHVLIASLENSPAALMTVRSSVSPSGVNFTRDALLQS